MRHFAFIVFIAALAASGCKDPRRHGQSSANDAPVPDGHVVLLRRTNEVAAFVLKNQKGSPEKTDFAWYYRTDGKGTFGPGDPAVSTGVVTSVGGISFATFSVGWSINRDGWSWVYFPNGQYEFFKAADYAMCVTTETNLAGIDATDRRWKYRIRPRVSIRTLIREDQ